MSAPQQHYLNLELSIEARGPDQYRATVREMPVGDGQGQVSHDFTLPFTPEDLSRTLAVLSGQLNVDERAREQEARAFGEALFQTVFAGPIYAAYFSSLDRARSTDGLRIVLDLDQAGPLRSLPWEYLRDPAVDYLALSRTTPVIRQPQSVVIRRRPVLTLPLRVLVMVSSPADLPPVDVQAEWRRLQAATQRLRAAGQLELVLLQDASLRTLQQMLRQGDYHAFHYIGHSTYDADSDEGMLALEDPFGENTSFAVRGEDLARELSEENSIRLVVLNSCQSAAETAGDPFAGIASSIVARGIPAVVAMQTAISDSAARAFSEEFYRAVSDGWPVEAAMSEARRAVAHAAGGIEWATPVLYLRAGAGPLFDVLTGEGGTSRQRRRLILAAAGAVLLVALVALGIVALAGGDDDPGEPPIDLRIEDIQFIPTRPAPGERTAVIVRVVNNSAVDVGPITYDFREDVLDAAPQPPGRLTRIGAGEEATIFIPHMFSWWGPFISEVRIDVTSDIQETDEFNNIRRSAVVTDDGPFEVDFTVLSNGTAVPQSIPLPLSAFEAWGFRIEALPGEDAACAGAVPWIFVTPDARFLGTALPDDPEACRDLAVAVVLERGAVGAVRADLDVETEGTYELAAFDDTGTVIDSVSNRLRAGTQSLLLSGGFPALLEIWRVEVDGETGAETRLVTLALEDPVRGTGGVR